MGRSAEDCGGVPGFYAALDAMADLKNPQHAEIVEWLDGYDPKHIDELPLKFGLGRLPIVAMLRTRLAKKEG